VNTKYQDRAAAADIAFCVAAYANGITENCIDRAHEDDYPHPGHRANIALPPSTTSTRFLSRNCRRMVSTRSAVAETSAGN
jgi:hypothetical protein